jgi:hypothetical protein
MLSREDKDENTICFDISILSIDCQRQGKTRKDMRAFHVSILNEIEHSSNDNRCSDPSQNMREDASNVTYETKNK